MGRSTTAGASAATTGTASAGTRTASTTTLMMMVAVMTRRGGTCDGSRCSGGRSCRSRGCRRRTRRIVKVVIVAEATTSVVVVVEGRIGKTTASAAPMRIVRVPVIVVIEIYGTIPRWSVRSLIRSGVNPNLERESVHISDILF